MSGLNFRNRHQAQRSARRADNVELASIREVSVTIDSGIRDDQLAGAISYEEHHAEPVERESAVERDLAHDTLVGEVQDELRRRARLLGDAYPFCIDDGTLRYGRSPSRVYEFFLASAYGTTEGVDGWVELPRLFERFAAELVSVFFGDHATAYHVGSPRRNGASFKEAWNRVDEVAGEWCWRPERHLPAAGPATGDEGCDYLIHVAIPGDRPIGQLFALGQCACGDNWENKLSELDTKRLRKWFSGDYLVPPVRTFATPFHVTDSLLRETSRTAGLLFDRARLTLLANSLDSEVLSSFYDRLNLAIARVVGPEVID